MEVNPRFPGTMPLTVASGVDMPALALLHTLGWDLPRDAPKMHETEMVRYWEEVILTPGTLAAVPQSIPATRQTVRSAEIALTG